MLNRRSACMRSASLLSAPVRSRLAVGLALALAALAAGPLTPAQAAGTAYFVSPTGLDTNSGTSTAAPFKTIQHALDLAQPGTTITLAPGTYKEAATTKVAGAAGAPITVKGPETGKDPSGRYKAVLYSPAGRAFTINHSFYTLDGFTIDGQPNIALSEYPTTLAGLEAWKDGVQARAINSKLVYVGSGAVSDVTATTISNMFLNGSGGECVRFRNRASNSLVTDSVIQNCGVYVSGDDVAKYRYHNGEGVYIGTSPKSTTEPFAANDTSNGVVVRNSTVHTLGAECFEVKENANNNHLENSDCGFNAEPYSWKGSNIELRGDHNLVLNTTVAQSASWNVKLASDSPSYDLGGNSLQKSRFSGWNAPAAIRSEQANTGSSFCGDTFAGTPAAEGPTAGSLGDPTRACPDTTPPTAPTNLTAKAASSTSITLNWTAATDDVGVAGYGVLRNGVQVATSTTTSYTDTGLNPGTAYSYTVVARDAATNTSAASAAATATTAPPAPTALTATATSATAVGLTWTAPANAAVASYGVLRNGVQVGTATTTSYTDSGLTASTAYSYTVVARDAAGATSPPSNTATATTQAAPPTAQTITVEAESGVLTAPMIAALDAKAQGGKYVVQTSGTVVGADTMTVNVPVAGRYALAWRVITPSTASELLTTTVDTGAPMTVNFGVRTAWTWLTGPTLTLSAGTHKIVVSKRQNGVRLDAVRLTPVA